MRTPLCIAAFLPLVICTGQIHVDRLLQFTSTDSTQRQVAGLAPPTTGDALISLATDRAGTLHVAQATGTANAITLTMDPPLTQYADGLLVRFTPTAPNTGSVTMNVDGLGVRKLLRPDLLAVSLGELLPGAPVEAQYADTVFILLHRAESGCPPGYLPVNGNFCIQQADVDGHSWFEAVRYCTDAGARLCTWDEYYNACMAWSGSLIEVFDDWEWADGTADRTHTALQCGRWQCYSERSIGATDGDVHSTRCCYRLR